jgi:Flp pilus assembly protein TadG
VTRGPGKPRAVNADVDDLEGKGTMRAKGAQLRRGKRNVQGGAAALEFSLAVFFLVPLLLGMMQFGYYFYVAVNVTEAQHQGLVAATRTTVGDCSGTASATAVAAKAVAQTAATTAVTTYLAANGLSTVLTLSGTSPSCGVTPVNPTWTMTLIADFRPPLGKVMPWDKASPTTGYLRYTAKTIAMLGN